MRSVAPGGAIRSGFFACSLGAAALAAPTALAQEPARAPQANALGVVDRSSSGARTIDDGPPTPIGLVARSAGAYPRATTRDEAGAGREKPRPVAFDLAVATEAPLMIGGQATLELPHGFLVQGSLGVMPGAYVNAVDGVLAGTGAYNEAFSTIVRRSLTGAMVGGVSVGVRPFGDHGFELMGGYRVVRAGSSATLAEAIQLATGATLPANLPDASFTLNSTLHNVQASVGWRWLVGDNVVVRASVGYLQTVGSSSSVEVETNDAVDPVTASQLSQANTIVNRELDAVYSSYVKSPLLGLSAGWHF